MRGSATLAMVLSSDCMIEASMTETRNERPARSIDLGGPRNGACSTRHRACGGESGHRGKLGGVRRVRIDGDIGTQSRLQ